MALRFSARSPRSSPTALRLARYFGTSAEFWVGMQATGSGSSMLLRVYTILIVLSLAASITGGALLLVACGRGCRAAWRL